MGIMYRRIGQARKAIENFDEAIRINPSHQMSRFNKGIVLLHDLNDRAGARQAWEKLFEMNPDFQAQGGQSLRQLLNGLD
jgi:tetratricopeptide (TPR) repeat protein